jgi:hypothetical protein
MGLLDDKWWNPDTYKIPPKKKPKRGKRSKRKIPQMTYHMYMGSAYWRRRKGQYFNKHGKRCAVCEKRRGVTLHHTFYDKKLYGTEPDSHFVALCGKHHAEFHQHHQLCKDMREATANYVKTARLLIASNIDDLSWI